MIIIIIVIVTIIIIFIYKFFLYWLLLTSYSIVFRDFPAMLTSPFASLVWSHSPQVGMETAFIIHYPYSCLHMKVTLNFLDQV